MTRQELIAYIFDEYNVEPDYPFPRDDVTCVFRHAASRKWFGIAMNIPYRTVGIGRDGNVDVLNIKCDPIIAGPLRGRPGFRPAYHMNKDRWITVLLDGSVSREDITALLAMSYTMTAAKPRGRKTPGKDQEGREDMDTGARIRTGGPDYGKCLVNLANSILKGFGAETTAETLHTADGCLAGDHRNVVLLLLDAMGVSIMEKHLAEGGFFRSHLRDTFFSVYPPTTVAATTSVLSGLYPNEHGWLGWDMFFPELGKNVTVFTNRDQLTEKEGAAPAVSDGQHGPEWGIDSLAEPLPAAAFNAGFRYTPYKNILDRINEAGGRAFASMPFLPPFPDTLEKVLARVKELCEEPGRKFIYAYWNEPDSTMHRTGTMSAETHDLIVSIEEKVKELADSLSDTLLLITADHSHMDSRNLCILDYPEVLDCLVRMPSIEPRTLNLFVREECRDVFPGIFRKHFGEDFLLLTREEALREKLFGPGEDRPGLRDMIGDYVALAVSDSSIFNTHYEARMMPGGHAGLTAEETRIPLIVAEK